MLTAAHFFIGMALTLLLFHPVAFDWEKETPMATLLIGLIGGVWANIPDLFPRFIPSLEFLHDSGWANVFYFHHFLDRIEVNPSIDIIVAFAILLVVSGFVYERYNELKE